jgi:cellulose synthase operon protein C
MPETASFMPPPTTKTLSPAELAKLEHAFATDPASDAYRPLAEAYLVMGRFMEAMVVCKKGVKAHPTDADPRVLLARVYADQGKDKKALEELAAALQVAPAHKAALRLTGSLQLKGGEGEAGRANLVKAWEADPNDEQTLLAFAQAKLEAPRKAAPPPPPDITQPVPAPLPRSAESGAGQALATAPPRQASAQARGSAPRAAAPARRSYEEEPSVVSEVSEMALPRRASKSGSGFGITLTLAFLLVFGLGGYSVYGRWVAQRAREVNRLLNLSADQFKADTFASYKKAAELAEDALNLDAKNVKALGYLAYAYAVRWGEHGGGQEASERAIRYLADGKARMTAEDRSSHLFAAEGLIALVEGKGPAGVKALEERIKEVDPEGRKASLLFLTLGIMQMSQGMLDQAKESLEKAKNIASDDPRVYAAYATLQRRRGLDFDALRNYDFALKYNRSHPDSLLGRALLVLDQDNPAQGYITAARDLKALLESEPPPSPRQLAIASMTRALLVSRVSNDLPLYSDKAFQKSLEEGTAISADKAKAAIEISKAESQAENDKGNPELELIRGKRLFWEKKFDESAAAIRKALAVDGRRAHFHVELARVLMAKEGNEKEAEKALRTALDLVPNSSRLLTMLGTVLAREKRPDDAIAAYEKAIRDPKAKNGEARFGLGRLYRDDKKNADKAIENFEAAAVGYNGDAAMVAKSYDEAGLLHEAKGNKDKADLAFKNALNAEPQYDEAYCLYAKFLSKDPAMKDKVAGFAKKYLELSPKGDCAAEMSRLQ